MVFSPQPESLKSKKRSLSLHKFSSHTFLFIFWTIWTLDWNLTWNLAWKEFVSIKWLMIEMIIQEWKTFLGLQDNNLLLHYSSAPSTQIKVISLRMILWQPTHDHMVPRTPVDHMQILFAYSSWCHMDSVSCFDSLSRRNAGASGTCTPLTPLACWCLNQCGNYSKEEY